MCEQSEFYYPDELVQGSIEWENATYKPENEEQELREFIEKQTNANTQKKTSSDMKVWEHFCQNKKEDRKMEDIPIDEIDHMLAVFFKRIAKKSGEPYKPDTLLFTEASTAISATKEPNSISLWTKNSLCLEQLLLPDEKSSGQWVKDKSLMRQLF